MPRKETPLGTGDTPLLEFAASLRALRRTAGGPPYRELAERAHYSVSTLSSAASGVRLPTLAVTLAYVRACGGDVPEWEDRWRRTTRLLEERGRGAGPGQPVPYPGPRPFREEDAEWFFGRERLVTDLAARLETHRLVVLIGASGSGKSSLLRAGLVPRLRPTSTPLVLTPGPLPATRLAALTGGTPADPGRALHRTAVRDGRPVVLIVDQFEEVFTLCRDTSERAAFIEALTSAADDGCRIVLGVRADFHAHCTLAGATRVQLGPMSPDELRRAIVEPARRAGVTVTGALLATLTAQAHGRPGTLPLLSHALHDTWSHGRGALLTPAALESAGGIEGALVRSAEEFYTALDDAERTAARHLLLRLTTPGEDTARRVPRTELDADDDVTAAVLERAAAARLVTLDADGVELTHEALTGGWPRLRAWRTADPDRHRAHRALTAATEAWETAHHDPGLLHRGARLNSSRRLTTPDNTSLNTRERAFLHASLAAEAAGVAGVAESAGTARTDRAAGTARAVKAAGTVKAAKAVRAVRAAGADKAAGAAGTTETTGTTGTAKIRTAPRSPLRLRALTALLCLTTALACVATALSVRAGAEAARRRDEAVALNAELEASRTYPPEPTPAARPALAAHGPHALSFSADGRLLVTAGQDGTVRLWDLANPARPVPRASWRPAYPVGLPFRPPCGGS